MDSKVRFHNGRPYGRLIGLMLACAFAVGCGDASRSKLVGNWNIEQAERVLDRVNQSPDSSSQQGSAQRENSPQNDSTITPKMQIQFLGNGSLTTITQMGSIEPTPKQGSWQMVSFDETSNTMTVNCGLGLQTSEHEIEFVDENTIKLVPPNMAGLSMKIRFTRQN